MSPHKLIATLLLIVFVLVTGAVTAHTHATVVGEKTAITAHEGHSDRSLCAFCKVVKERYAIATSSERVFVAFLIIDDIQIVDRGIHDMCPLQTAGRAPPRI